MRGLGGQTSSYSIRVLPVPNARGVQTNRPDRNAMAVTVPRCGIRAVKISFPEGYGERHGK